MVRSSIGHAMVGFLGLFGFGFLCVVVLLRIEEVISD